MGAPLTHRDQILHPRLDLLDKVAQVPRLAVLLLLDLLAVAVLKLSLAEGPPDLVLVAVLLLHLVVVLKLHPLVRQADQLAKALVAVLKPLPLERHHQVMVGIVVLLVCSQ
jgi:hypothetical protein